MVRKMYERACNRVCNIVPQEKRTGKVYPLLNYAGITEDFELWLGKRMLLSSLVGLIGFLIPLVLYSFYPIIELTQPLLLVTSIALGLGLGTVTGLMFYMHLYYLIDSRTEMVEDILPDFLLLVASNIRTGLTPFTALRRSVKEEFGPLSEEVKIAASKSLGTESFTEALKQLGKRIDSKILKETVSFFSQALRSGGHLAELLETSAQDIRATQELKKELVSSTKMYVIFVFFVLVIATPLLLAVSVQFLTMIDSIQAQAAADTAGMDAGVGFLNSKISISPDFMQLLAYILLFGNALLGSFFVGVLQWGKAKKGAKYFPIVLVVSFIVLMIAKQVIGGIIPTV